MFSQQASCYPARLGIGRAGEGPGGEIVLGMTPEPDGAGSNPQALELLQFWFETIEPRLWFARDGAFDARVRQRFLPLTEQAAAGTLLRWGDEPLGALALVLLLDQLPRQIWRGSARAFSTDPEALALSQAAVARGWVATEPARARRQFWLMPMMHSEDLAVQEASLPLFARWSDPRTALFAQRHHAVIARFGRFPHRNQLLGRPSTPEETAFLLEPGSRF